MRIIFIRHGDPDYLNDRLTEKGKKEAKKAADRLSKLPISYIYSSPLGRAKETAEFLVKETNTPLEIKDFLRETPCFYLDNEGNRFVLRDRLPSDFCFDQTIYDIHKWEENENVRNSSFPEWMNEINKGMDGLLEAHGYKRKGNMYEAISPNHDVIVIFAHFGSICACLSRLTDISPQLLWHHFICRPSSITTVWSEERRKGEAIFRISNYGDTGHLDDDMDPNLSGQFCECYADSDKRHD